jgi:hypothetical protein
MHPVLDFFTGQALCLALGWALIRHIYLTR